MNSNRFVPVISGVSLLFLLISSCGQTTGASDNSRSSPAASAAHYRQVKTLEPLVQSGDMIFRNGNDEVSRAARTFNRKDTSYSHCGLLFMENDSVVVYHALGGIYNPSQKLLRQPLDSFCNPAENNAVGVYRYPLNPTQLKILQQTVSNYYKAGLPFDLFFNYRSDDRMYCSEFVFKSLNRAVDGILTSYVRTDTLPYGVTTDDLYLHPLTRLVKKEKFIY
jgi:hypothetical protein